MVFRNLTKNDVVFLFLFSPLPLFSSCFFFLFHHLLMTLSLPLPPFPSLSLFSPFLPSISLFVSLCMIFRNLTKKRCCFSFLVFSSPSFQFLFLFPFSSSPDDPFSPSPSLFPISVSFFLFSPPPLFCSCFFFLFHHLLMSLFLPLPPCFPSPSRFFSHFPYPFLSL